MIALALSGLKKKKKGKQKDQQLSGVDKQQRVQVLEGNLDQKTERGL